MNPGTGKDAWQMDLLGGRYNSYDLEIGETLVPLTSLRVILQCWHLGCQGGLEKQLLNLLPENENSYHQWSVLNFLWVVIICYILYSYHCYWVTKLYPTLCEPRNLSTSASLSFIISMNLLKLMSIETNISLPLRPAGQGFQWGMALTSHSLNLSFLPLQSCSGISLLATLHLLFFPSSLFPTSPNSSLSSSFSLEIFKGKRLGISIPFTPSTVSHSEVKRHFQINLTYF